MNNAIFLDIDGTLLPFGTSDVPESALSAIRLARKKGNLVFINTGRCRLEVVDSLVEIGFDGIICSNAMYIEQDGKVLKEESLEPYLVKRIGEFLEERDTGYFFEGHRYVCASPKFFPQLEKIAGVEAARIMKKEFPSVIESTLQFDEIGKINFFQKGSIVKDARALFGDSLQINEWSLIGDAANMGEMTKPDANKANGVDFMLKRHGIDVSHSFAFGDTLGDLGMLKACGVGVAMGNASEALKKEADYVCESVCENGIFNAFKKFDLI